MSRTARQTSRRRLYTQLIVAAVIVLAALFRPRLEAWLSETFPEVVDSAQTTTARSRGDSDVSRHSPPDPEFSSTYNKSAAAEDSSASATESVGRPADATAELDQPPVSAGSTNSHTRSNEQRTGASQSRESGDEPPPGQLKLIGKNVFRSTAGLVYGAGSREGHRLKHILKHAKDDLSKPVHGVFDGDRDQILRWIDLAFMKTAAGGRDVRKDQENRRTAWTVNMQEKIGHVGGHRNQQKKERECRYLKLVLEDDNRSVVTAYPTSSF